MFILGIPDKYLKWSVQGHENAVIFKDMENVQEIMTFKGITNKWECNELSFCYTPSPPTPPHMDPCLLRILRYIQDAQSMCIYF